MVETSAEIQRAYRRVEHPLAPNQCVARRRGRQVDQRVIDRWNGVAAPSTVGPLLEHELVEAMKAAHRQAEESPAHGDAVGHRVDGAGSDGGSNAVDASVHHLDRPRPHAVGVSTDQLNPAIRGWASIDWGADDE
jgi:hypothetical protein